MELQSTKSGKKMLVKYLSRISMILVIPALLVVIFNVFNLLSDMESEYKTPWYENSWLGSPIIKVIGMISPATEYWTRNAIGSEFWLIREVKFGSKTYWTVLEKRKV